MKLSKLFASFSIFALLFALMPGQIQQASAISPDIVISQVYGGGGNSGATYTHDFIELFNRGTSAVSLAGWSVQYASATGTGNFGANSGQLTELPNVSLAPGQYLLIQEAQGAGGTDPLPTPDVTDATPINMSATGGKVALVNSTTSLGCNGSSTLCSPAQLAQIVDLVGYGSANFYEGSAAAPTLSNTTAALRVADGCQDTDNNSTDFTAGAPNPRNTASPLNPCSGAVEPKINEFVFNHVGTDTHEYAEIFGSPDTDYSAYTLLQIEGDGTGAGVIDSTHTVESTDTNGFWYTGFLSNVFENGTVTLLLVKDFTGAVGNDLDTNNDGVFDSTPWSALVDDVAVSDGGAGDVTYSSTVLAPGFSGSPFTPGGASRFPDGASDWVLNDFDGAGLPGFLGSPVVGEAYNTPGAANELVVPPPEVCGDPFTPIYAVQGSGLVSPLVGSEVAVEGIVVGDFQNNAQPDNGDLNGFHIQDPIGDGDPSTSDGIFVFAPGGMDVSVGDKVRVRGTVMSSSIGLKLAAYRYFVAVFNWERAFPAELP
jgi:predicted extracellular nuclease